MAKREIREFAARQRRVAFANGTVVWVPEVPGSVKQWLPQVAGSDVLRMPAERDAIEDFFDAALAEHGIREEEILQLDLEELPREDAVVIEPDARALAGVNGQRVLLYRDESGGFSWHFAEPPAQDDSYRAGTSERFIVPLRTAEARASLASRILQRGILTSLGRKLFKILVLPFAPALLERPLWHFVRQWEEKKKSEMLRVLTPDNYRSPNAEPFTDFDGLANGRGLLVVHGIFSSPQGMLSRLSPAQMEELQQRYSGRVMAFDHFTVSKSPEENARDFLSLLRDQGGGRTFEFDVLTHSRGGIVARALREREPDLGGPASFRRIFFVAPPNHGSALANADRIVDMIDVFTNLITDFPDGPIAYSLEILLALAKGVAFAAIHDLGGIRDMAPGANNYIERVLNRREVARLDTYACATANYEPDPAHDSAFFTAADGVIDRVFGRNVANDLVVPTLGAFEKIGAQRRDIARHEFPSNVSHTEFFAHPHTVRFALEHFEFEDEIHVLPNANLNTGYESLRPEPEINVALSRDLEISKPLQMRSRRRRASKRSAPMSLPTAPTNVPAPAPAAATAMEAVEPVTIERKPDIKFEKVVIAGDTKPLVLSLKLPDAAGATDNLEIELAAEQTAVGVRARLIAPGFDVKPPDVRTMSVGRTWSERDETCTFELTAQQVEQVTPRTIYAELSIGTVPIGGASHVTVVLPNQSAQFMSQQPAPSPAQFSMGALQREKCDMKITVSAINSTPDEAQPPFPIAVTSSIEGMSYDDDPLGSFTPKGGDVLKYLQTTFASLLNARPEAEADLVAWNRKLIESLHDFGTELWSWLPAAFRDRYFAHVDANRKPRSIFINSVDMFFPWELIVPWRDKPDGTREELAPLGQAHIIGRWKPGLAARPEPQRYSVHRVALLHPRYGAGYALSGAQEEAVELAALLGARAVSIEPGDEASVKTQLLGVNDVQLLHFCGHAKFDDANPDQSYLLLADETPLTALQLASSKLTSGKPFIVLNACSVGAPGIVASRAGGFAAKCLNRGCSAVLAAYWPVSDRSAKAFSLALYKKLKAARSFGEALQELRTENPDNPTCQAYTFFGDPLTRLLF